LIFGVEIRCLIEDSSLPRLHDLRRSCTSLHFPQGSGLRLVMEILGRSQIAITANLYTHLLPEADREAAGAMEAVLGAQG